MCEIPFFGFFFLLSHWCRLCHGVGNLLFLKENVIRSSTMFDIYIANYMIHDSKFTDLILNFDMLRLPDQM